jgi:MFS family permease
LRYRGWALVWALGITATVSYGTMQYFFAVLLVPMQRELGWSRALISGAFSVALVSAALLGLPVGRLVDRHGARGLMTAGSLLGGAGLIATAAVRQPWQFYVLWSGVIALSMSLTLYPVAFTVITNWFVRRRGAALALLTLLGGLASPIFIPLAGLLVQRLGWRETLVIFGLVQLVVAVPLHALVVRRRPEDLGLLPDGEVRSVAPEPRPSGLLLREAVGSLPFWTITASGALAWAAHFAVLTHQVAYLIGRGFDPVLAASAAGLLGAASLPGRYVLNRLSDRLSSQTLLACCTLGEAVGVVLLTLAATPALIWAYVVVYGASFGATSSLRASTMADHFGRRAFGAITAAAGIPIAVASSLGPIGAGVLYDRVGSYGPALALIAAAFVLSAAAIAITPRRIGALRAPARHYS